MKLWNIHKSPLKYGYWFWQNNYIMRVLVRERGVLI